MEGSASGVTARQLRPRRERTSAKVNTVVAFSRYTEHDEVTRSRTTRHSPPRLAVTGNDVAGVVELVDLLMDEQVMRKDARR